MALKLTLLSAERGKGPYIFATVLITPSGNYTQGGDVLDLTQLYGQSDPAGRNLDSDQLPVWMSADPSGALAAGTAQNGYQPNTYTNPADGTPAVPLTPATCKFQVYGGSGEINTGAYPNAVLSDHIVMEAKFLAQQ